MYRDFIIKYLDFDNQYCAIQINTSWQNIVSDFGSITGIPSDQIISAEVVPAGIQ